MDRGPMVLNWLSLDTGGAMPLYHQIAQQIREAVLAGSLPPGLLLPSSRGLARDLGLSRITAMQAYDLLAAEGFLETRPGSGTRVAAGLSPARLSRIAAAGRNVAGDRTHVLNLYGDEPARLAFQPGIPAFDAFPHALWARLLARAAARRNEGLLDYAHIGGYAPLREQIARYLAASRGVRCTPEQIIVVTSVRAAIIAVAGVLWPPAATVAVEDPGYGVARRVLAGAGCRLRPVPVDRSGLCVDRLIDRPGDCAGAYLTPAHHWPSGVALSAGRRVDLLDWAIAARGWIIEDDYDSEFRFDGPPLGTLYGLGSGRVIYVGTFSKTVAPSLHCAYLVVPRERADEFRRRVFERAVEPSLHVQAALADFLSEGHFVRHIARMRKLYASRRQLLIDSLTETFGNRLSIAAPPGGLQITAHLPGHALAAEVTRRAAMADLVVRDLAIYCVEQPAPNALHLGFAAIPEAMIPVSVRRLAKALDGLI